MLGKQNLSITHSFHLKVKVPLTVGMLCQRMVIARLVVSRLDDQLLQGGKKLRLTSVCLEITEQAHLQQAAGVRRLYAV